MTPITMTDNGRIVIPAALRNALGLKPRTALYAEAREGGLFLISAEERRLQRRAYFERMLPAAKGRSMSEELIAERRLEAAKE